MSPEASQVLLHPVRLRIVLAVGREALTTAELHERLPDIPHATLYRQVATLAEAGMLEVVAERRVRGGVERRYTVVADAASLGPEEAVAASAEDLLRGLTIFAGSLIDAAGRYLDDPRARPAEDPFGFRQASLWLDEDEAAELVRRMREAVGPYLEQGPTPGRRRVTLSTVLIPDLEAAAVADRAESGAPSTARQGR